MPNNFFQFKQFKIQQDKCAMKVTTDSCLFGAWVAEEMQDEKLKMENVADIGTGTGLLSLMIAQKNECFVDAVEIDKQAAEQAKENIAASAWKEKISVINEDVLKWETDKKYDVIICNPPFYENELKSGLTSKNVAHHSIALKLEDLLQTIAQRLADGGSLYLLLPFKREKEAEALLAIFKFYVHQKLAIKQTASHKPFRLFFQCRFLKPDMVKEETIAIKESNDQYTKEFIALLKEYYLHL